MHTCRERDDKLLTFILISIQEDKYTFILLNLLFPYKVQSLNVLLI